MCLLCFSSEPLSPEDMQGKYGTAYAPFINERTMYDVTMCGAPCAEPGCWCVSMFCIPCAQFKMRHKVLNHLQPASGWSNYKCCQGYFGGCCCLQPGNLGDSACPVPCMCLEACLCPGVAASVNSMMIRERYGLGLDKDDVRLIRCNNCLMCFSCVLSCIGICLDWDGEQACKSIVNCIADVTFCCVSGCMTAQTYHEIKNREGVQNPAAAPGPQSMSRE